MQGLITEFHVRRFLRGEIRERERQHREYTRALQIGAATCSACGRRFRVIPRELSPERPAGELPAGIPIEGGSTTMPDGTFRCECGAVGWMRGACVLDPRAPERPPSATQRRFLEALAEGPRTNLDLSEKFLQSDLSTYGEVSLALAAGWATAQIGGIGGLVARPPLIYELTDRGREALGLDPE